MRPSGIWITGEPASGKTTLARRLVKLIPAAYLLDGDEVRQTLTAECDFSAAGRRQNVLRVAAVARKVRDEGRLPIVALVSPVEAVRQEALAHLGGSPLVVALEAPLELRVQRARTAGRPLDPAKAFPYEPPVAPDLLLDTSVPPRPLALACTILTQLLRPCPVLRQRWGFLHHRCASLWWRGLLATIGDRVHPGLSWHGDPPQRANVADLAEYATVWDGNARWETLSHLDALYGTAWCGVHVYRDPRDLLVSAYWSHRHSHPLDLLPGLRRHRPQLQEASLEEGLLLDLDFYLTRLAIETIGAWSDHPRVLPIPYEQMFRTERAVRVWATLGLRWLGVSDPLTPLEAYLRTNTFRQLAEGRERGTEAVTAHYRVGRPGSWAHTFTPKVAEAFTARYGDLLVRLGYVRGDQA